MAVFALSSQVAFEDYTASHPYLYVECFDVSNEQLRHELNTAVPIIKNNNYTTCMPGYQGGRQHWWQN